MRRSTPSSGAPPVAAAAVTADACTARDSRCRSATRACGARPMRRSGVLRRFGRQGSNGPRSRPCGCAATFESVSPRENGFQPAPRLPRRMPSATLRFGVSQRDVNRAAQPGLRAGSCTPMRSARRWKISQSCNAPGGLANSGFEYFTVLRTASRWNTTSKWSRSNPDVGGRIRCAWRVVSLRYGSIETMKSSPANACSSLRPFGVESTGLPAEVTSARICPLPGARISSASADTGNSLPNSGRPRTRVRRLPNEPG